MKIGFIGLGKLGLPIAEAMAEFHEVEGFDVAERSSNQIRIVNSIFEVIKNKDFVFIAVQTPHDPLYDGSAPVTGLPLKDFDYSHVVKCLKEMAPHLKSETKVVLISTVLPGTTRREFAPLVGNIIYNPYLIAMGTEVHDFFNPEMIIMGSSDASGMEKLKSFYEGMMQNQPRYSMGTWEEAESVKIFYNTFISVKLSLVNMIQDVAMRLGHMNVDVVTTALAESKFRIMSSAYMKAGMGDGGPCHPRDNIALRRLSEQLDLGYDLFGSIIVSREIQAKNLAAFLVKQGKHVTIIGKAYKPDIHLVDGSYSLLVAHYVKELGGTVSFYDPNTGDTEIPVETNVYLIGYWSNWTEKFPFKKDAVVVDPWRRMKRADLNVVYYGDTRDVLDEKSSSAEHVGLHLN